MNAIEIIVTTMKPLRDGIHLRTLVEEFKKNSLIIGSVALLAALPKLDRVPADLDIITSIEVYETFIKANKQNIEWIKIISENTIAIKVNGVIVEFSIAWEGTTNQILLGCYGPGVANLSVLLFLKLSHRFLKNSPHFLKTLRDIQFLRSVTELTPSLKKLMKQREQETYTYSHPKLNQAKKDFFDASVKYVYDHDTIHRAIAVEETPAYTKFAAQEVLSSKTKFFEQPERIRLLAGLEESCVLAVERSLVPFPGVLTPKNAFLLALMKVCTSITSGWFREFCWENYDKIVAMYSDEYVTRFERGLKNGIVKPFSGEQMA